MTLAAKRIDGVKDCKASYKKGTAEVTYDPSKTTPEAIARAISETTGFKTTAPSSAAAVGDARVLFVEDDAFNDLMADNPALPLGIARFLAGEVRRLLLERGRGTA